MSADDDLLFTDDDDSAPSSRDVPVDYLEPWVVLVVDDEPQIHDMTQLLMKKFVFQGRGAELLSARSAAEAKVILAQRNDIAVILLDVVMESEDAGLKLVQHIRNELNNRRVRIVLRTGQPGQAPERDVIVNYDINDYKAKTELTSQKLFTTMVASLRSYQDIVAIERNRVGLEKILNASSSLFDKRSMREFVEGAIIQLEALLRGKEGSVLCCQVREGHVNSDEIIILAGTRTFSQLVGMPLRDCLPFTICAEIERAFATQENLFAEDRCILVFRTHDHGANVFFLRRPEPFTADEKTLLEVFCSKVAIGFDNVCLYEDLTKLNNTLEQQVAERTREVGAKTRLLETVLASMSDGLTAVDENGALLVHNRRAFELLGLPGGFSASGDHAEMERRISAMAQVRRSTSTDPNSEEIEFPDGRVIQLRHTPMEGGGRVYVCQDITTERQRQRELIAARAQAEQASRAKSQFLATMSHEIRTPMTGVQGMLDLLQHTPLNEDQSELVGVVRESAASLLTILNDILDFSKIEAGKMVLEDLPLCLPRLVESTAEVLAPSAFAKGISLVCIVDPALPAWLRGDSVRLRQILFNLLGNAIKFTESGHVILRAERISGDQDETHLRLSVEDTGIGIAEEAQGQLFKPFSQADATTTRRFGGTGLGLSICRHLTELMGGQISVESAHGGGSIFHVTVRLESCDSPQADKPLPRLDDASIAIQLNHPAETEAASRYLTAAGAVICQDAQQADLVLVDGDNPSALSANLSGLKLFQLAGRRRGDAGLPGLPATSRPILRNGLLKAALAALGQPCASAICAPATLPPRQDGPKEHQRILVAEDNPVNRMVIGRLLKLLGYDADIVEDGQQALDAWNSGAYGLLLTDCHMPVMDGFELTRSIRAKEPHDKHTPIIAFTAAATSDEVRQCEDAGMDDFLPKPVELDRLRDSLSRWLA